MTHCRRVVLWLALGLLGGGVLLAASSAQAAVQHSQNIAYVYDFGSGVNDANFTGSSIFENAVIGSPPGSGNTASYTGTTPAGSATYNFTDVPLSTIEATQARL